MINSFRVEKGMTLHQRAGGVLPIDGKVVEGIVR